MQKENHNRIPVPLQALLGVLLQILQSLPVQHTDLDRLPLLQLSAALRSHCSVEL